MIWLYYLGVDVRTSTQRGRVHRYHEEVLESLGRPDNPFFDIFGSPWLLDLLRWTKRERNKWRHDNLPITCPSGDWQGLTKYLRYVNDALCDALEIFGDEWAGIW